MPEFEMRVVIRIEGYESLYAETQERAVKEMQRIVEEKFTFAAPLVNVSSECEVWVKERDGAE